MDALSIHSVTLFQPLLHLAILLRVTLQGGEWDVTLRGRDAHVHLLVLLHDLVGIDRTLFLIGGLDVGGGQVGLFGEVAE